MSSARWALRASGALACAGALAHCGLRTIDAVDRAPEAPVNDAAVSWEAGAEAGSWDAGAPQLAWPNATSATNSEDWLVAHHDELTEMHPKLLVLDFYNGADVFEAQASAARLVDAIAFSSRYHAYEDANAPAFLVYDLLRVIDLTDPPMLSPRSRRSNTSSSILPTDPATGAFNPKGLFGQEFARHYGYPDPNSPSQYLNLCELFEQGIINELWLETAEDGTRPPLELDSRQRYGADGQKVPGSFDLCAGTACLPIAPCGVSVRIGFVNTTGSPGCDLVARTTALENSLHDIPELAANALDFFNHDFDVTAGMQFASFEDLCGTAPTCVSYPTPTVAQGYTPDGGAWRMDPFIQGCGTSHFPANGRHRWDYYNTDPVRSRCEHYQMLDGRGGVDTFDLYSGDKVAAYDKEYGGPDGGDAALSCGAGWQVYLRQSMPGLHNAAHTRKGGGSGAGASPMKNWWPYLFY